MSIEILVPVLPESVADASIAAWNKKVGDSVTTGEVIAEIETDKVVLEVPASADGTITEILAEEGATVAGEQVIGKMEAGQAAQPTSNVDEGAATKAPSTSESTEQTSSAQTSPAVRKILDETQTSADAIQGSGKNGRILKSDVLSQAGTVSAPQSPASSNVAGSRDQERVPMTRLRARIAERLLDATQSTAMLTTFNEVNMKPLMDLRSKYKDLFEKTHDARLGFMSLFVKASTYALRRFPEINASIEGPDMIYHRYCDIGIAVSSERGLVVPILRNAEHLNMAEIESQIVNYAGLAKQGKLGIDDLTGGTFTITNGGVFGSLLSTPILNPPQSAILGMHSIQKRPVVENDEIVIRPMMYLALSYDHRVVDGKGAVSFLKTIKELVEDPHRILLDV